MLARWIYSILLVLVAPLAWGWLLWRQRKGQAKWSVLAAERFGHYPQPWDGRAPVWVHTASVGEVRAAAPLIEALVLKGETVLLTHFTPTGRAEAQRLLNAAIHEGQVRQQWLPYDFAGATRRFVKHFQPRVALLVEREVWPNLVHQTTQAGVPVVLVSARFSERSSKQTIWINRILGGLLADTYAKLALALAQTQADGQRLFEAGVPEVQVSGNLKFDINLPVVAVQAGEHWRERLQRPVIAIASTREGEDRLFIGLLADHLKQTATEVAPLFVLIPRHPQRFDSAARLLDEASLRYARWSVLREDPQSDAVMGKLDVVLGDTMGEMPFFYGVADVAIVAGSFENHGGQNFIECCATGTPVIVGPHTRNFSHAVQSALAAGAIVQVKRADQALSQAMDWLSNPQTIEQTGKAGRTWVMTHVGATDRILRAISELEADLVTPSAPRH